MKTIYSQMFQQRRPDFHNIATRRAEGALLEINQVVKGLLEKFKNYKDAQEWDILPKEIEDYDYAISMIKNMLSRLENPF